MKSKLSPSRRVKKRYLLLQADGKEEIEEAILDYIGVLGWAKASPVFLSSRGKIILGINRKEVENVKAAFGLSKHKIKILKVSGTLKGLSN